MDNVLIARLALEWLAAERSASVEDTLTIAEDAKIDQRPEYVELVRRAQFHGEVYTPAKGRTDFEICFAVDRVMRVLAGEIRWSETSAGDRAIWKLRFRDVTHFLRWRDRGGEIHGEEIKKQIDQLTPTPDPTSQEAPYRVSPRVQTTEQLWWYYYDTATLDEKSADAERGVSFRLFTHKNVGNFFRSNLQVAGQVGADSRFIVTSMWMTISNLDALGWFGDNVRAAFVVGDKAMTPTMSGKDLFMGVPFTAPYARPLSIPSRQAFTVQVHLRDMPPRDIPFDMTFYFAGLQTRSLM